MENKQLSRYFKQQTGKIAYEMLTGLWKGNLKKETKSLLIAAQNNVKRPTMLNDTQHKSKGRLCGGRDEMINHIVREHSKLAQREYRSKPDWVGKMIHWKLCKWLSFNHTTKWYIHKTKSILENEMHKILWDFEIQTDLLIPTGRPGLVLIN